MDLKLLCPSENLLFGLEVPDRQQLLLALMEPLLQKGTIVDSALFLQALEEREVLCSTQINGGIAFPHACSEAVQRLALTVAILPAPGLIFNTSAGENCRYFFMIAIPVGAPAIHLSLLSNLAEFIGNKVKWKKFCQSENASQAWKQLTSI